MKRQNGKTILIIVLFLPAALAPLWPVTPGSPAEDYPAIFAKDYQAALDFIGGEKWFSPMLADNGLEPAWATAIVFPELIRYSRLFDVVQTRSLEVLYVQYGKRYADFSIGRFQLKPSFAERLEADALRLLPPARMERLFPVAVDLETAAGRRDRVQRLGDPRWSARYLLLFIAVAEKYFDHRRFRDSEEKLLFFATAFNYGYWRGEAAIRREIGRKRFHLELLAPSRLHSYARIALDYYRRAGRI